MILPPAENKYNKDNENQSRNLIAKALNEIAARLSTLEAAPATTPPDPDPNAAPTASFTFSRSGLTVSFTSTYADTDGTVVGWAWDFGDNTSGNARNPIHTYNAAGTYNVSLVVTDDQGAVSTPATDTVVITITTPSGFRTMHGVWGNDTSKYGADPTPDDVSLDKSGSNLVGDGINRLAQATAQGGALGRRHNSNPACKNADGSFNVTLWQNTFQSWWDGLGGTAGQNELRAGVRDGYFRYLIAFDDYLSNTTQPANGFLRGLTFDEIDTECCAYAKNLAPWLPLVARGTNVANKAIADRKRAGTQFRYLDAGWMQFRFDNQSLTPAQHTLANWDAGEDCGLGGVGGANLLNGGDGIAPWNLHPNSSTLFGMSPTEMLSIFNGQMADDRVAGFHWWSRVASGGATYCDNVQIKAAMQTCQDSVAGRTDGPINIRGDLAPA